MVENKKAVRVEAETAEKVNQKCSDTANPCLKNQIILDELNLLPQHKKIIIESAIIGEVAEARKYTSCNNKKMLSEEYGFKDYQAKPPALVCPVWGPDGKIRFCQIRSDNPRKDKKGKAIKYETPSGIKMALDVPPGVLKDIGNPKTVLFLTE